MADDKSKASKADRDRISTNVDSAADATKSLGVTKQQILDA